jgi:hypothetical protein
MSYLMRILYASVVVKLFYACYYYLVLSNVLDDLYVEWFTLIVACESIRSVTAIVKPVL